MIKRNKMDPETQKRIRRSWIAKKGWITRRYGSLDGWFKFCDEHFKDWSSISEEDYE